MPLPTEPQSSSVGIHGTNAPDDDLQNGDAGLVMANRGRLRSDRDDTAAART
jgi:hypothetical protein